MASHPTQPNEQRRRLLKAASAAPVIFTLPVGSSVAAGSVRCDAPDMNNTIEGITIGTDENDLPIVTTSDGTTYTITNGTVQVGEQVYVIDDLDNLPPRLVTGSCWTSLITASAGSSTNIV